MVLLPMVALGGGALIAREVLWNDGAGNAADANTATTAALVLGGDAPDWLSDRGVGARLLASDGSIRRTPLWPTEFEEFPA